MVTPVPQFPSACLKRSAVTITPPMLARKKLYSRDRVIMKYALVAATAMLASLSLLAQTPTTLRVDVRLVNVVTTVTDSSGKFVPGLTADDFTLLEDGVPQ